MNKGIVYRIIVIIVLIIVLAIMLFCYFRNSSTENLGTTRGNIDLNSIDTEEIDISNVDTENESEETETENETTTTKIVNTTTEVTSGLTEQMELYATKYLEECLVEEDQEVSEGENILEYTDGTYLTAPYDCVIKTLNIPNEEGQCTNEHYIEISSTTQLAVSVSVDETELDSVSIGQEASITISALDDAEYTGYVTNISNTASNGNFTITIEFDNDGNIKIGMSADVVM